MLECKDLNYLKFQISKNSKSNQRYLYIFKTHDVALLCWFKEQIKLENEGNFFLLTIDNHIDLPDDPDWEILINDLRNIKKIEESQKKFKKIKKEFQNLFQGHDVNFILAALELGLIQDCLIISPEKGKEQRKEKLKETYEENSIFFNSYLSSLFFPRGRGILNDRSDPKKMELASKIGNSNLILDLDLDYFTYSRDGKLFTISDDNFDWLLENEIIKPLFLNYSNFITIALEPNYCNSNNQNNCCKIFNNLMEYFNRINLIQQELKYEEIKKKLF